MSLNYKKSKLGDIGKVLMCKRVLKNQTTNFGEIPFYKISTFGGKPLNFISKSLYENYRIKYNHPKKGDILISAAGTIGKTVIYDGKPAYFQDSNIVWIENNENKVINEFLYYYYQTQPWIATNGSTIKRLYNDNIRNLIINYPEISVQKKIAKVLSDLDAKIETNNKINQELEAMAKTLYDYWFVQFDFPNEQGKPYKSSGGKMVFNEALKREIPEGWEVKELSNIANITMGQSPSGTSYNENQEGEVFYQGCTDFGWRFPSIRLYTTEPKRMAKIGDILLSVRAPVGTLNIANNNSCIGRGLAALNSKHNFNSYLFYVMVYFKQIFDYRNNSGTTFGSITKDDLFSLKLAFPNIDLLEKYDQIVSTYNKKILNNHKQNQQLTKLRDWLLPMLMNGQVTVTQAEEHLQQVAEPRAEYGKK